jgi:Uma2 family endonuclease
MNGYRILPNYTYDDYCQWEGKWEIIDGIPYAMSPMPSPRHQLLANEIGALLSNQLKSQKCSCRVYQTVDVRINDHTVVCPDIVVACQSIEKNYIDFPPTIVVEIFSPSTKVKDLNTKFDMYENFGIPFYIMVDPETNTISIYQLSDKHYEKIDPNSVKIDLGNGCQLITNMSQIFD